MVLEPVNSSVNPGTNCWSNLVLGIPVSMTRVEGKEVSVLYLKKGPIGTLDSITENVLGS